MRIVLVSNTLPPHGRGGAEGYVDQLATELRQEHDVLVLTAAKAVPGERGYDAAPLPALPELGADSPYSHKLVWHARDQWRPTTFVAASRILRRFRPDVVHTHECQGLSAAIFTAIERAGLPHVHTAHDLNLLCAAVTMTRNGEYCGGRCRLCRVQRRIRGGAVRRHITRLVSVSEYIQRRHLEGGIVTGDRAVIIRLGARPAEAVAPRRAHGLHVGFLGALAPHKGPQTLVAAFRRSSNPDWRLSVAGSGELEGSIRAAAAADPRIRYLGHIGGDAKDRFFAELDVLAVPSEWEEPAATVATEALVRGIPILVSDRGGSPEFAEARVFPAKDVDALYYLLAWFSEHPDERAAIAERLRARRDEFLWSTHYRRITEVLRAASQELAVE